MSFETPKGKMTFRKEDHQAMQSCTTSSIKVDPAFAWGVPELVREIPPDSISPSATSADAPDQAPRCPLQEGAPRAEVAPPAI
jgi:hypothetical protein